MGDKRKYIVTADDYGLCPEVNIAIEKLAERGILSTTNVLTNFQSNFLNSPIKTYRRFSIGIHWNVTTGKPVSNPEKIRTLISSEGEFYALNEFRKRFALGLIKRNELRYELESQYNKFYECFGIPDYWNSHENSALYPAEYRVFESVALDKGIKGTRNFQRVYIDYDQSGNIIRKLREFLVSRFVDVWFGHYAKRKFIMPEGRIITFSNINKTDITRMRNGLAKTHKKSIEIVIHPAIGINNQLFGNIGSDRIAEFEKYMTQEFYDLFENERDHIISYEYL